METSKHIYPGDIILFRGKSFISRGIRFFTKSKWNHAALALDGSYLMESTSAGVEKNSIIKLLKKSEAFCILRDSDLAVSDVELIKSKAYSLLYENYDFLQLISMAPYFALRAIGINAPFLVFNSRTKMICSELCYVSYLAAGIKLGNKAKLVSPESLYKSPLFEVVYEGDYNNFQK